MCDLLVRLPQLLPRLSPELLRHLRLHFPRACAGDREDAAQEALLVLVTQARVPGSTLRRAWEVQGEVGVQRFARAVGWRALRGRLRRKGARWTELDACMPCGGARADEHLRGRRSVERLERGLAEVGPRFSPRNPEAMRAAVLDSLGSDEPDARVAARHALRREPLCRARRWLRAQILDGAEA